MTSLRRRRLMTAGIAALVVSNSRADRYPSKPIRLIVPFPAGGPTDMVARPIAALLGESLGQQIIVDNRGGAGGVIGADVVAKSPSDGYTLLMGTVGTSAINSTLYKKLPHDPISDFTPLATIASAPVAIVVRPESGVTSLKDLVAKAKANPGVVTYGSAGNGTPGHLAGAMFCSAADIKLMHIPYKGSAPAVTDLLGGQIAVMFDPLQSVYPHVQAGKLKVLAVTGRQRAPVLPNVPTVAESGWPDFEMTAWWAMFGPARLPGEIFTRLQTELDRIVRSANYRQRLGNVGLQPISIPLADFQRSETAKWGAAVRNTGIILE